MIKLLKCFVIIVFLLSVVSCSTNDVPDATKKYYLDLYITSNNQSAIGMIVLPKQSSYTIQIQTDEKVDAIYFRTCSREIIKQDPRRGVISKKYTINYTPNEIELAGRCSATISVYNDKAYYSVGFIDFEDDYTTLPAKNICEDLIQNTNGVSVCQTRASSIEKISFDVDVLAKCNKDCNLDSQKEGKDFIYEVDEDFCTCTFMEKQSPNRIHRLTTYGYKDFLR